MIRNLPADLQKLPSFASNGARYFYNPVQDGSKQLIAMLFGKSHFVIRFPKGTVIDALPADSVGSEQIIDGSVGKSDLSQEVLDMISAGGGGGGETPVPGIYGVPMFVVNPDNMYLVAQLQESDPNRFYVEDGILKAWTPIDVAEGGVTSEMIKDGTIRMEDLSDEVRRGLDEMNNIGLSDEDMENWFDDDPTNDDPEE